MSKEIIEKLQAAISDNITIDDGAVEVDDGVFWGNAPEGVTPEVVETVRKYESDYVVASAKALGTAAEGWLKDNPDDDLVCGTFRMGPGVEVNHSIHNVDGDWQMVSGVERQLTGEQLLSEAQAEVSRLLVG